MVLTTTLISGRGFGEATRPRGNGACLVAGFHGAKRGKILTQSSGFTTGNGGTGWHGKNRKSKQTAQNHIVLVCHFLTLNLSESPVEGFSYCVVMEYRLLTE